MKKAMKLSRFIDFLKFSSYLRISVEFKIFMILENGLFKILKSKIFKIKKTFVL